MCAFTTREESQHYIFLFSAPSLCPQSNVQVSTADNLWKQFRPDKCYRENACMCRLVSAVAAREKCSVSFSAPICVLNHLLLVSSADNLFKQLGPSKTFLRKWRACEVPHEPSLLERKVFFYFLSAHFCFLLVPFFLQSSFQFC